jgi:hypothetical protein
MSTCQGNLWFTEPIFSLLNRLKHEYIEFENYMVDEGVQ